MRAVEPQAMAPARWLLAQGRLNVGTGAMLEALRTIYGADALAQELAGVP